MSVKSRYTVYVRATAIIMLFAMFHYVAGYRLMYSLGILYTKDEAKECMVGKTNIKKLTFSASEYNSLQWSEQSKEFSFNNQMYDVVSMEVSGNSHIITAYADDPETELVTAFHNFEKEIFHPDQSAKGAKSADDIMSAFQKDCTPTTEFKIDIFASDGLIQPCYSIPIWSGQVSDNIWHPPAIS